MTKLEKNELISLRNTNDSFWFIIRPSEIALGKLNIIFDLSDEMMGSYQNLVKKGDFSFSKNYTLYKKYPKFLVYFIFTKMNIHLILRKIKDYKKIMKILEENFKFKEEK